MRRVRVLASVLPSVAVLAALGEGLDTLGVALDFFGAVLDDFAGVLASFVAFADLLTAAFVLFFRRVAFAGLLDELPAA